MQRGHLILARISLALRRCKLEAGLSQDDIRNRNPSPDNPNLRDLSSTVGPPSPVELGAFRRSAVILPAEGARTPTAGVTAALGDAADLRGVFLHDVCFQY